MTVYRFVFRGELPRTSEPMFEEMAHTRDRDTHVLVGEVVDQAHLHGLLARIAELELELVAAEPSNGSAVTREP